MRHDKTSLEEREAAYPPRQVFRAGSSWARAAFHDARDYWVYVPRLGEHHEYRVDFCWEDYKTIAEADGLMKYDTGGVAIRERRRDRLLQDAGYEVVHITWRELFGHPDHIIRRLRRAFAKSNWLPHGYLLSWHTIWHRKTGQNDSGFRQIVRKAVQERLV